MQLLLGCALKVTMLFSRCEYIVFFSFLRQPINSLYSCISCNCKTLKSVKKKTGNRSEREATKSFAYMFYIYIIYIDYIFLNHHSIAPFSSSPNLNSDDMVLTPSINVSMLLFRASDSRHFSQIHHSQSMQFTSYIFKFQIAAVFIIRLACKSWFNVV